MRAPYSLYYGLRQMYRSTTYVRGLQYGTVPTVDTVYKQYVYNKVRTNAAIEMASRKQPSTTIYCMLFLWVSASLRRNELRFYLWSSLYCEFWHLFAKTNYDSICIKLNDQICIVSFGISSPKRTTILFVMIKFVLLMSNIKFVLLMSNNKLYDQIKIITSPSVTMTMGELLNTRPTDAHMNARTIKGWTH